MANAFSRSWQITKLSFGVIRKDKELLLFPILAFIFSIIFIAAVIFPPIILSILKEANIEQFSFYEYIILFATYLGLAFIATFFNVCVVYTTKKRFKGGNATFIESIKFAFSKIHLIFSWSLLAATIGLILRIVDNMAEKSGNLGKVLLYITRSIFGMVWGIVTIFVVPGMVYNNLGPIDAIKKSVEVLKKTWGESLVRYFGLGLAQFLFIILGIIVAIPLLFLSFYFGAYGIIAVISVVLLYLLAVILVFGVASTIFNTALYVYANTGKIPAGYDKEIMENAFKRKVEKQI